jgi:hypothetical protein
METPIDYLTVPDNQNLVQSNPRRTASFNEKLNQLDERLASSLSLPSATNSILKKSNSPRNSISSRLNVHYTPVANENDDKVEIMPTIEPPPLIQNNRLKNFHTNNRHHSKPSKSHGFIKSLRNSRPPTTFLQERYEKLLVVDYFNLINL